ncbi:aspartate kinase, partial [Colletotrichum scovillei]
MDLDFDEVCLLFPVRRDVENFAMNDVHGEDCVFCADDE